MTSTTLEGTSETISTTAARLAMGRIVSYQTLLIVLIFLRPDLDPSWHTISEWAIGPHGWIMSGAFLISAVSYAALFVMLKSQLQGTMGRIGLGLPLMCVIGATGVGFFTTDPMHLPLSRIGTLHVIFGTSQLVLLPFAALFINLSLARKNKQWQGRAGFCSGPLVYHCSASLLSSCTRSSLCFPWVRRPMVPALILAGRPGSLSLRTCCGS